MESVLDVREPGGGFQTAQCHNHLGLEHKLSAADGRTDWGSGRLFQLGRPICHPDGAAIHATGPTWQSEGQGGHEEESMVQIYSGDGSGGALSLRLSVSPRTLQALQLLVLNWQLSNRLRVLTSARAMN